MDFASDPQYLAEAPLPEETEAVRLLGKDHSLGEISANQAVSLLAEVRKNRTQVERHVWRVLRKQMRSSPYRGNRATVFAFFLLVAVGLVVAAIAIAQSWF